MIGLGHKARHGKDTAAKILSKEFGAQRFSFADDIYAVCRVLHGMTVKDAPLLQRVGVQMREEVDKDIWIKSVYAKMLQDRPHLAVITDVRFPNEFEFVKALGGVCLKVERRLLDGSLFVDPSRPANHVSETANDHMPWDRVIVNEEGRLEDFEDRVLTVYLRLPRKAA